MSSLKAFVIAGTNSGCGKTSVSLGIMGALARRGLVVNPFKTGPDFIDPGHHALAAALRPRTESPSGPVSPKPPPAASHATPAVSHNLDSWMLSSDAVRELFHRHVTGDVGVVEGVMGLFDGFSATQDTGSTAQVAKLLGLPVILVVNAASMARSAAALISGYANFDPDLHLAGVILNRVGSDRHADMLVEAVEYALPKIPVLGCLRREASIELPSRHLGLVTAGSEPEDDGLERYHALADWVEQGLDLDRLLGRLPELLTSPPQVTASPPVVRLGVARDAAFCFYYDENLRLLESHGAELVFFSPSHSKNLPPDLDGLYLGGGYPELAGHELSQNVSLRKDIKAFSEAGKPVYAECGGFMYLLDSLAGAQGCTYAMCGVFAGHALMCERFSALGYREITTTCETLLGPAGTVARGHEFHYSKLESELETTRAYAVTDRRGDRPAEGYLTGNTLGSYIHLHFGSNPDMARHFVAACAAARLAVEDDR